MQIPQYESTYTAVSLPDNNPCSLTYKSDNSLFL